MNATLNSILADLDSIGLDELNKRAAMLTRVDRKYALDAATASAILSRLPEETRVLRIGGQVSQGYASTYYDTPDMDSYLLTALKRRRRFKVVSGAFKLVGLPVHGHGRRIHCPQETQRGTVIIRNSVAVTLKRKHSAGCLRHIGNSSAIGD